MTTATTKQPLYVGATTCDFRPEWTDTHPELLALLGGCFEADPDELTPQLVVADWLQEHNDPREAWVRAGVAMWAGAAALKAGKRKWDYEKCKATLGPTCETVTGWRMAGLWGCLVAWHSPAGDGSGLPMGRTWVDARVKVVQRSLWFWGLGFLSRNPVEDAAWSQAYAAWSQAYAAGSQAYAAGSQAYAAWSQADAAWSQAYAAWSQADAAGRQAYAAWRQADAAWSQADAAWSQADVWRFARTCWEKVCGPQLKKLSA